MTNYYLLLRERVPYSVNQISITGIFRPVTREDAESPSLNRGI